MAERRYTKNGEWASRDGAVCRVGLAASAAAELGDVTFVELPQAGRRIAAGEAVCALEAVKAAADFYCPVDGRIAEVNQRLTREPTLVNTSPEEEGWLFALEGVSEEAWNALLKQEDWQAWETGR